MLLFNIGEGTGQITIVRFKYNICYCSTKKERKGWNNDKKFKYNICYCSTQMLILYNSMIEEFKYNICYCSTLEREFNTVIRPDLNTTFVTVQPTLLSHSSFIIHLSIPDIQSFLKIFSNQIIKTEKLLAKILQVIATTDISLVQIFEVIGKISIEIKNSTSLKNNKTEVYDIKD